MPDIHRAETTRSTATQTQFREHAAYLPTIPTRRRVGSRRRLVVVLGLISWDALLALAMWQAAFVLRETLFGHSWLSTIAIASIVPNVVAWLGLRAALGLYPGYGMDQAEELRRQTFALLATLTIIVVFAFASDLAGSLSRVFLFAWALGLLLAAPVARYFVKAIMMRYGLWGKPVVVLGGHEAGAQIVNVLQKEWQLGFRPVGLFDIRADPVEGASEREPYLGALDAAKALAEEYDVDTAVFTMQDIKPTRLVKLVDQASTSFRYVMVMPDLGGITNSAVIARDFAGHLAVEIKHNLLFPWARRTKHVLDLLLTIVGGLMICPLLIAIAVLIKLDSPGPPVYGHRRVGAGGKHFRCWKFRTMYTNAEQLLDEYLQGNPHLRAEWEQTFKLRDDPRVTRVGRFLRMTSLDELPQLWNVLLGQMSLVGPRPIVDAEIPRYGAVYELYKRIRPGISGFWQVSGRSNTSYAERVNLDAYYVHNWSVWIDLVILVRTLGSVVLGRGAY
jgi:Undecaprenyl-phosphate galactose phosphotransferase WbaP